MTEMKKTNTGRFETCIGGFKRNTLNHNFFESNVEKYIDWSLIHEDVRNIFKSKCFHMYSVMYLYNFPYKELFDLNDEKYPGDYKLYYYLCAQYQGYTRTFVSSENIQASYNGKEFTIINPKNDISLVRLLSASENMRHICLIYGYNKIMKEYRLFFIGNMLNDNQTFEVVNKEEV